MGECTDVQSLEKISTEVDESQIKITLSSHCIKAQAFLVDKLRKQSERQREVCGFISSNNVKLEAEIKQADHEIQSLRSAYNAIRSANVELRKELLLAKENKREIEEHVRLGEKKYEELWLASKSRYEGISYVQKLLETKKTAQKLKEDITVLQNDAHKLVNDIDSKKIELRNLDRQRIIELANYFVNEMPVTLNVIKEKSLEIKKITREIEEAKERKNKEAEKEIITSVDVNKAVPPLPELNASNSEDNWPNLYSTDNQALPIPKLKLVGTDFDVLSAKLDQIKIKKVEMLQTAPVKRTDSVLADEETTVHKKPKKIEENTPYYFSKPASIEESSDNEAKCNFSSRKLINILEDIKLDKSDTYKLVSKVNIENLKDIDAIGTDATTKEHKEATPMESEQIEEIDLTGTNSGSIVVPPTQFMDYTQEASIRVSPQATPETKNKNNDNYFKNSQENVKKRVSFDMPSSVRITPVDDDVDGDDGEDKNVEAEANKTASSELDISGVSDDGYKKIRDMILKKHNLDLSPQFVYAKNKPTNMRNEENVTSKFFQKSNTSVLDVFNSEAQQLDGTNTKDKIEDIEMEGNKEAGITVKKDENIMISDDKIQSQSVQKSVSGFLFKHGPQEIPDSLNVSISTTGYDEGEVDFPHCLDSSLLLSPKADLPMPMTGDNAEVLSQEVPNFLSGLRKTGLSFFGLSSSQETNSNKNGQNTSNNFNFNFGGDDKKNRGGLFSMFR
ncbi:uncharacterized protein LOC128674832 [Plodia interpunctella]|uniref:uncharacterized protein LOC128674832 n=1 Tax=Plodia interpunctella TaxID=58824 RepID=UPI0023686233|nr:uncharacterized protein LOC128674832 [Plodia interpunctella]